jgi:UDP-2,3-diacylglucosamine pyrophosphatase LpxH
MNDAIILSDLHLGSKVCQAKLIVDFLEQINCGEIETHELILNGDVFDSWDFRRLHKHHWRVLSELRSISDHVHVVWINGNHDGPAEIISHLLGVDVAEEYIFNSGTKKILALHGDRFDKFISKHPILTRLADTVYRLLQRVHVYWAQHAKRRSKTFLRCSDLVESKAKEYAVKKDCDVVCCGHTHLEMSKPGDISYYNSGCWTERPCTYLAVKNGEVTIHHFGE